MNQRLNKRCVTRLMSVLILLTLGSLVLPLVKSATGSEDVFTAFQKNHWAFQKITRPDPPAVKNLDWVKNPIDAFIVVELEAKGLVPSPPADKVTLLRRATLDLTGLPPTPEEVDAFLKDQSPQAFEKVVDRLLASPHYGERWARHWLDLARYAESDGFRDDVVRPNAWRYRDYVIKSLNSDKPYDRFMREQIAGDELWPDDPDARVATGFNRHYADEIGTRKLIQRRQEILNDITDTVGSVFLGLTYGCARCHDHKFDPLLHSDYYGLQAFFANVTAADRTVLSPSEVVERHREQLARWEEKTRHIRDEIKAIEESKRTKWLDDEVPKYPVEEQTALRKPDAERTPLDWQIYYQFKIHADRLKIGKSLKDEAVKKRWEELQAELKKFSELHPGELDMGTGIVDVGREAPKTFVLDAGAYDAPVEEVQPRFPSILHPGEVQVVSPQGIESSGRRSALANWLADPENPLPSRVMVNRIWHYHFGRGLVATPSNFGLSGNRPTHPKVLDWLASEFIRSGWSIKHVHRLVMTSNTYQQSSLYRETAAKVDSENRLLWRFPRQRLEGEVIRDASLEIAGLLNKKIGGPSMQPELPPGVADYPSEGGDAQWKVTKDPAERNRRSVYILVRRNLRYPMFVTFDMADTNQTCPRREVTTSPLQALTMLNSEVILEWSQAFAGRVLRRTGPDLDAQIERAYRLAYSRQPSQAEKETAHSFFKRHRSIIADRAAAREELAVPPSLPENVDPIDAAALVDFCHMLVNSNEFVYQD